MSCNCSACTAEKAAVATNSVGLPTLTCKAHTTWMADYCLSCQSSEISNFALIVGMNQKSLVQDYMAALNWEKKVVLESAIKTLIRKDVPLGYFAVLAAYGAYAPGTSVFMYSDLNCNECDQMVSQLTDPDHWDLICGDCGNHEDGELCVKCSDCGYHTDPYDGCECCSTCGNAPGWCSCCNMCGESEYDCECEYCEDCGYKGGGCGCSSTPYRFGTTKDVPWETDDPKYAPMADVPSMSDLDKGVDPVRAAADFYLLNAMVGKVRIAEVSGAGDNLSRLYDIVRDDSMMSSLTVAAKRDYEALVARLDANFLAYAVSAVGGELRYHRACSSSALSMSRSDSWGKFVEIVREKGAAALFDAEMLFEEFESGSYGGHKWAVAAKIVGQRLSGNMPAWLFVDRMFTLEHNGGCFLNKVNWATSNELGYGLHHMRRVLDAHASSPCDYSLLLAVATPGIAASFQLAERRLSRLARRVGGVLAPIPPTKAKRTDRSNPCPWCGYYACVC